MATKSKNVAKKAKADMAVAEMDILFEADAGAGLENLGQEDLALPFVKLLQKANAEDFDAKTGDILNTVTGDVYPGAEGVLVIPCAYQRRWIEWSPIGDGQKGPVNIFSPEDKLPPHERSSEDNKEYIEGGEGNYLEDTHNHFVLVLAEGEEALSALVAMRSTGLKKSKKWNSMIASRVMQGSNGPFQPPRYSHVYRLKTVEESGQQYKGHNWDSVLDGRVESVSLYTQAKMFGESVGDGGVVVKHVKDDGFVEEDTPF